MQPFINPYLFSNPIYGNYGQQQFQQPMQQQMSIGISGKYVNDFGEITASDIPMNSPAIFAKNDRSEIQLREWNSNGQIVTTSYKAVNEEPPVAEPVQLFNPNDVLEPIFTRLNELEEKIDKLPKVSTVSRTKKDGE